MDRYGIPSFAELPTVGPLRRPSMTEDEAASYATMRGYATESLRRGEAEGLYRTIDSILLRALRNRNPAWLLDAGCGTGRTLLDMATAFPAAQVVGLDADANVLHLAHAAAHFRGAAVTADLRPWGFGAATIAGRDLDNALLIRADCERLPFGRPGWDGFDAVSCVNLLDRATDPAGVLAELLRVLAPGGRLVLASPLDWRHANRPSWPDGRTLDGLCRHLQLLGLQIDEAFDGLVYREIVDLRGSALDWQVAVVSARRIA